MQRKGKVVLHQLPMKDGVAFLSKWPVYLSSVELQNNLIPVFDVRQEKSIPLPVACPANEFVPFTVSMRCLQFDGCSQAHSKPVRVHRSVKIETSTNNPTDVLYVGALHSTHTVYAQYSSSCSPRSNSRSNVCLDRRRCDREDIDAAMVL